MKKNKIFKLLASTLLVPLLGNLVCANFKE